MMWRLGEIWQGRLQGAALFKTLDNMYEHQVFISGTWELTEMQSNVV